MVLLFLPQACQDDRALLWRGRAPILRCPIPLHYYPSIIALALLALYVFWSGRQAFRKQRPAPSNIAPIGHVRLKEDLSNSPGRRKDDEVGGEG